MNDEDRVEWVRNDEALYQSWKGSRMGIYRYVKENRKLIDDFLEWKGINTGKFTKGGFNPRKRNR